MVKVEMPRASWSVVLDILENAGAGIDFVEFLITDIETQVYSQEY